MKGDDGCHEPSEAAKARCVFELKLLPLYGVLKIEDCSDALLWGVAVLGGAPPFSMPGGAVALPGNPAPANCGWGCP